MFYAIVIFISAFLIFLVQPLIAKQILPWFGGSAAVWGTCLLFFQSALLAGYAYADVLTRYLSLKRQVLLHGTLLLAAALTMPIIANDSWRPLGNEEPILRILGLLLATVNWSLVLETFSDLCTIPFICFIKLCFLTCITWLSFFD